MYQMPFDDGLGAEVVEIAGEAVEIVGVGKELVSAASWQVAADAAVVVASCIAGVHNNHRGQVVQSSPMENHHVALTVAGSDLS
jgi:hypothetical protein